MYELTSAANIITFLQNPLPSDNKILQYTSSPIPYSEYLYLSKSAFLVNLTVSNKEFPNLKSALSLDGQFPSNFTCIVTLKLFIPGLRPLLDVDGGLILSSDDPFDFHAEIYLLLPVFLKNL